MTVFVQGNEAGHRHGGHLQTEEEHEEVVGTHHHEHTQQGGEDQHVELALLEAGVLAAHPLAALNEHEECSEGKHGLDYAGGRRTLIHSAEGYGTVAGEQAEEHLDEHECAHERVEPLTALFTRTTGCEQVGEENHNEAQGEQHLGFHQ